MLNDITCEADAFAASLNEMLDQLDVGVVDAANKATAQSVRKGAKFAQEEASNGGLHKWSGEYVGGFSSHVNRSGHIAEGEVGNKAKPGLVHLLEKGHATLTGRRTNAYPHMKDAFDRMKDDFMERMDAYVGEAIG